jgi:hypothetical protein
LYFDGETGSYTFNGSDTTLNRELYLSGSSGAYVFNGSDATLTIGIPEVLEKYEVGGDKVERYHPLNGVTLVHDVSFPWDVKQRTM